MKELVVLMMGLEITEIMARNQIMERVDEAETTEEKSAIVAESIELIREFADKVFKDGENADTAKEDFLAQFTAFQYEHFGLPVPA